MLHQNLKKVSYIPLFKSKSGARYPYFNLFIIHFTETHQLRRKSRRRKKKKQRRQGSKLNRRRSAKDEEKEYDWVEIQAKKQ